MNISINQQVTATYARNHFKEVNNRAIEEGMCVIMRKSKPVTVILSVEEYERMLVKEKAWEMRHAPKKKITLEELKKDSFFSKYAGCLQDEYPGKTALDLQHEWYKYVD